MLFENVKIRQSTLDAIEAILEVTTDEEKELLAIQRGNTTITFKDQLITEFGEKYAMYNKDQTKVRAARILDRHRLTFEKLKQEEQIIKALSNPESFFKTSEQETGSDKKTGIRGATDTTSEAISFDQTKGRAGSASHYKEHDLIGKGDEADKKTIDSVMKQNSRSELAQDGIKEEVGEENQTWQMTPVNPRKPDKPPELEITEISDEGIPLSSLNMSTTRGLSINKSNSGMRMGRAIDTSKTTHQITKTYVQAQAIKEFQKTQYTNVKARIVNDFACLFSGAGGVCQ